MHRSGLRGANVVERHGVGGAAVGAGAPHAWVGGVHVLVPLVDLALRQTGRSVRVEPLSSLLDV